MAIVAALHADLVRIPSFQPSNRRRRQCLRFVISMKDDSVTVPNDRKNKKEGSASEPQKQRIGFRSEPSDLRFDRLQPSDDEVECKHKRAFGRFVAREALLDEEFWTAAWPRAENHWEDKSNTRHVDSFKLQFAEQEFNAIKRRCIGNLVTEKSTCIIVVKKEDTNVKRTVLSSIIGTLDITLGIFYVERHF